VLRVAPHGLAPQFPTPAVGRVARPGRAQPGCEALTWFPWPPTTRGPVRESGRAPMWPAPRTGGRPEPAAQAHNLTSMPYRSTTW